MCRVELELELSDVIALDDSLALPAGSVSACQKATAEALLPYATLLLLESIPTPAWDMLQGFVTQQLEQTASRDGLVAAMKNCVHTSLDTMAAHPVISIWRKIAETFQVDLAPGKNGILLKCKHGILLVCSFISISSFVCALFNVHFIFCYDLFLLHFFFKYIYYI